MTEDTMLRKKSVMTEQETPPKKNEQSGELITILSRIPYPHSFLLNTIQIVDIFSHIYRLSLVFCIRYART